MEVGPIDRFDVIEKLIEKALKRVEEYFAAPQVMVEFMEIIDDPNTHVDKLTQVVESDPSLSLGLLRLVNSAAFGIRHSITSVRDAILYLGFNEVKNLFLARLMKSQLRRQGSEAEIFSRKALWQHSVATAVLSKLLSKNSGLGNPDTVYVVGLIHDIGWVGIELGLPETTRALMQAAKEEQRWPEGCEIRYLGFTHEDAGAWLLQKWALPEIFRELVRFHHRPDEAKELKEMAAVVKLADTIGSRTFPFFPDFPVPEEPTDDDWKQAQLSPEAQDSILEEFLIELTKLEVLLRF